MGGDLQVRAVRPQGQVPRPFFGVVDATGQHAVDGASAPGRDRLVDGGR
jgi:hypothetical protein